MCSRLKEGEAFELDRGPPIMANPDSGLNSAATVLIQ